MERTGKGNGDIMDSLDSKQQKITKRLGLRKTLKLVRLTNNLRNIICDDCRAKFDYAKANLDTKDYCKDCKPSAEIKLKQIEALCK